MKDYLKKQELRAFDTKLITVGDYILISDYKENLEFTGYVLSLSPYQIVVQRTDHHRGIISDFIFTPNSMVEFNLLEKNKYEKIDKIREEDIMKNDKELEENK